jgi:hypothetical protein
MAYRRRNREFEGLGSVAAIRAWVAYRTVNALLPDGSDRTKMRIARRILSLCDGKDRSVRITEPTVKEMVLRNSQCIAKNCPMLLFTEPLARELNCYFSKEVE